MPHTDFKGGTWRVLIGLVLFCSLLMLYRLDGTPHRGRFDDVDRALVARTMEQSGDWLVPHLGSHPLLTKPPLMYWTVAAVGRITGRQDELPGDLTSALAMILVVVCTWWIGRNLLGEAAALRAGLILPTMFFFLDMSRHTLMDTVLLAAMMLCAGALVQVATAGGVARGRWWLLATVGLGAVIMTKGPVGIPLLAVIAAPLLWRSGVPKPGRGLALAMVLLLAALVLPWPLLVLHRVPEAADVWARELVGRLSENEATGTWPRHPYWFYLPQLSGTLPWLPLLIPALVVAWRRRRERAWRTLGWWVVGGFLFYTFSSTSKRSFYLLPLYPGMALMIAGGWDHWFAAERPTDPLARRMLAVVLGLILTAGAGFLVLPVVYPGIPRVPFTLAGTVTLLLGAVAVFRWGRHHPRAVFSYLVAGCSVLFLAWFGHLVPLENRYLSGSPFFEEIVPRLGEAEVILVEMPVPLTAFYLHGHPYLNEPRSKVLDRLREDPRRLVVTTPRTAGKLGFLQPVLEKSLRDPFGRERTLGLYRWWDDRVLEENQS